MKTGILTSEFWLTVGKVASSIIMLLVLVGYVKPEHQESLTTSIVAAIGAIGVAVANAAVVGQYIRSRTELKKDAKV